MQTGPKAETGFDLALTELIDADSHEFLIEVGSKAGAEILGGFRSVWQRTMKLRKRPL